MRRTSRLCAALLLVCASSASLARADADTTLLRCIPFDDQGRKIAADAECPSYKASIIQLLARPEIFDGKRVQVIGFVHLEFEGRGVYIRKQDYQDGLHHNGLWVGSLREAARVHDCQDNYVIIEGRFDARSHGHMGLWGGSLDDITICGAL